MPSDRIRLRTATRNDLPALLVLEMQFPGDRMSRRQFRRHLCSATACLRVAAQGDSLLGASLVFFRKGSARARLYSLVVSTDARGRGLGARLLADAERCARRRGCTRMCLEVRADNGAALKLYRGVGYESVAVLPAYYQDGCDGLRCVRDLSRG